MNLVGVLKQAGVVVGLLVVAYVGSFGPMNAITYYRWENWEPGPPPKVFLTDRIFAPLNTLAKGSSLIGQALEQYANFWLRALAPEER
jgi:hypothetical protein